MWSRIHLIPLLTAEEDRDLVRRHYADQAREKDLTGKSTSPYNSDRYVFLCPWVIWLMREIDLYDRHMRLRRAVFQNRDEESNTLIGTEIKTARQMMRVVYIV
jgi:hypothetical protein